MKLGQELCKYNYWTHKLKLSKNCMSTQKTTSSAGTTEFPFDDLDKLIEEEHELPPIPDFPSIYKLNPNGPIHW